jgi:hypothetical protein
MNIIKYSLKFGAVLFALGFLTACESTEGSSGVSGGVYYDAGLYDPWYGGVYDRGGIIVAPPPSQGERPVRPEQPIYQPSTPRPTPMPSIPSTPRPATRR